MALAARIGCVSLILRMDSTTRRESQNNRQAEHYRIWRRNLAGNAYPHVVRFCPTCSLCRNRRTGKSPWREYIAEDFFQIARSRPRRLRPQSNFHNGRRQFVARCFCTDAALSRNSSSHCCCALERLLSSVSMGVCIRSPGLNACWAGSMGGTWLRSVWRVLLALGLRNVPTARLVSDALETG